MAADRHSDRQAGDVRRAPLDVDTEAGRRAAELRSNTRFIDELEEIVFEFRIFWHRVMRVDRTRQGNLAHDSGAVHRAADADADDHRRARVHAGMQDDLHDSLLDALKAVSRYEHLDAALILGTEALRLNRDLELVARNDLRVDDARRVILGVDAVEDWLCNDRFSQVAFRVALGDTVVDCLFEATTLPSLRILTAAIISTHVSKQSSCCSFSE